MNATLMSRSFRRRVSKLKAETLPQTFSLDDKGNKKTIRPRRVTFQEESSWWRRVVWSVTVPVSLSVWTSSKQTSDNLLKTQLDGGHIGFLWLSVLLKYHYRGTERRKTRDKEQETETNTHRHREREREIRQRGRLNEAPPASKND